MMGVQALLALFKDASGTNVEHAVQVLYDAGVRDGIQSVKHKEKPITPPVATPPPPKAA